MTMMRDCVHRYGTGLLLMALTVAVAAGWYVARLDVLDGLRA